MSNQDSGAALEQVLEQLIAIEKESSKDARVWTKIDDDEDHKIVVIAKNRNTAAIIFELVNCKLNDKLFDELFAECEQATIEGLMEYIANKQKDQIDHQALATEIYKVIEEYYYHEPESIQVIRDICQEIEETKSEDGFTTLRGKLYRNIVEYQIYTPSAHSLEDLTSTLY